MSNAVNLAQQEVVEEDEQLYVELVEYVRLAVFDIYAQLRTEAEKDADDAGKTMH